MPYKRKQDHAAYMRRWRQTHPDVYDQRRRARAIANVYKRRGLLTPKPCEVCGEAAQMHHDDYDRPLKVRWLCRPHHLMFHMETP